MAKRPLAPAAPADPVMSDDDMEALELSAPPPPEDESPPDEAPPVEPSPVNAAPAGAPMEGWVSATEHAQLRATVDLQNRILQDAMARLTPAAATPAAVAVPTYVRPGDATDVAGWRGFVGETVDPVVEAKVKAAVAPLQNAMVAYVDQQQEVNARNTIPDYDVYADDVKALRAEWYRTTGQVAPHITAYHVARSMRMAAANPAARQVAPSAVATVGRPAAGRPKVSVAPKTLADVANMGFKDMEAALANVRL